ncbi:hypothetical protein [Variovorax sp. J22R115]|uniref:hypothetical protein n=1 Tax=Variovorax sp. J22R115 TaxID=3053509 RepID=UPI002576AE65|nr:hypothetical protein [Variovorax sp. J22R115]MDM0052015.1 hypothetical protein [Variovorax sp. J22R115]
MTHQDDLIEEPLNATPPGLEALREFGSLITDELRAYLSQPASSLPDDIRDAIAIFGAEQLVARVGPFIISMALERAWATTRASTPSIRHSSLGTPSTVH